MGKSGRLVAIALIVFGLCAVAVFSLFGPWRAPGGAHTLAVLPLRSPSGDAADAALGLAMSDALILRFRETGAVTVSAGAPGADTLLEGTVQAAGGRLRVGIQLLRAGDGRTLWKKSFDVPESEASAIENAVFEAVSSRLRLK
jgi:TolB-like protein